MVNLFSFIEDYLVDKEDGIRQLGYFCPIPPKCILRNEKYKNLDIYILVILGFFCCSTIIMASDPFSFQ
jgi:hypothetical protein